MLQNLPCSKRTRKGLIVWEQRKVLERQIVCEVGVQIPVVLVFGCAQSGERETETEREIHIHTERERHRETHRETEREIHTHTQKERHRETHRETQSAGVSVRAPCTIC